MRKLKKCSHRAVSAIGGKFIKNKIYNGKGEKALQRFLIMLKCEEKRKELKNGNMVLGGAYRI